MMDKGKIYFIIVLLLVLAIFNLSYYIISRIAEGGIVMAVNLAPLIEDADYVEKLSNKSHSMSPTFDVWDSVYTKEIGINNPIYVGRIYVYERWEGKENRTQFLMHRLVGVNDEKTKFVFLGDNNLYVDPLVNRSQIMREVIGACFNRLCEE